MHTLHMRDATAGLNPEQLQAVTTTEGPVLVLAGAGSGKTKTVTQRIAYLVQENKASPDEILAVTFTNKAAGEMRERLAEFSGQAIAKECHVLTFHALCMQIARLSGHIVNLPSNFALADPDDSRRILESILKARTEKKFVKQSQVKSMASRISSAKNENKSINSLKASGKRDDYVVATVWEAYERELKKGILLDFDNLLKRALQILKTPEGAAVWSKRFQYIMVDEFQDSNQLQVDLLKLLSGSTNLCVTGDDFQAVYGFRHSKVEHILGFEKTWPGAKTIILETNYRSAGHIIDAANSVIAKNKNRTNKKVRAHLPPGQPVRIIEAKSPMNEAHLVADRIQSLYLKKANLDDMAIIYRNKFAGYAFEQALKQRGIPYRVIGGEPFYKRPEIKAARAWLQLMANPQDNFAFTQAIANPKRGVKAETLTTLEGWAKSNSLSLYQAAIKINEIPGVDPYQKRELQEFAKLISALKRHNYRSTEHIVKTTLENCGLMDFYRGHKDQSHMDNLMDLVDSTARYKGKTAQEGLRDMVEMMKLDQNNKAQSMHSAVTLITFHSTKGLEFDYVFLSALQDESFMKTNEQEEIEESRRLFYVGITRAKRALWLCYHTAKHVGLETVPSPRLRFLDDLPANVVKVKH